MVKKHKEIENVVEHEMKEEYRNLEDFMKAVPEGFFVVKHQVKRPKKKIRNMFLIHKPRSNANEHMNEVCAVFIDNEKNKKISKIDQNKMREEVANLLLKHFTPEEFIKDFANTLDPIALLEAYERAIIKGGKVREIEDCYGWDLFGKNGTPLRLQLTQ